MNIYPIGLALTGETLFQLADSSVDPARMCGVRFAIQYAATDAASPGQVPTRGLPGHVVTTNLTAV